MLTTTSPMKWQFPLTLMMRDARECGQRTAMVTPPCKATEINGLLSPALLRGLWNLFMSVSSWRIELSGFTISLWCFNYHFKDTYCRAISPVLSFILGLESLCPILAIMTYREAIKPTFGKRARPEDGDVKMPADGLRLYHCINHVLSNGLPRQKRRQI